MEAQIHQDGVNTPGLLVSSQYLSQVITDTSATTYKFGPLLESNTSYWIVFTTSNAYDWKIGLKQIVTSSIDVDAGFAYTAQANDPGADTDGRRRRPASRRKRALRRLPGWCSLLSRPT
jgi:hypothetical protein